MKKLLISLILLFPLTAQAGNTVSRQPNYRVFKPSYVYSLENRYSSRTYYYRALDARSGRQVLVYVKGTMPKKGITYKGK